MFAVRGKASAGPPPQARARPPSRTPAARRACRREAPAAASPVEPVRLGAPAPPGRRDRSGIDHMALDPLLLQNAVEPEPIQPRLLDRDDRIASAGPDLRLALELLTEPHQPGNIAGRNAVLGHLLALARRKRGDQPIRTAQFQRHKNCAKLRADSGRSVGRMIEQHRRLQVEWFCNSSLASDLVAIHSPWNLRRYRFLAMMTTREAKGGRR